ncbi:MAG: archaeosine biosynthesis radical SAM protein RaSEA [Methanohalobium sp.]|uniref:archaeosine biosynthesis radical SAM protein RaSEA n=1 Tax=Methanohalobium sp. TaxID=2837493 RepID=UPI00397E3AEB
MSLNQIISEIRNKQRIKPSAPDTPTAVWTGHDNHDGKKINTLTIIFKTSGCWWGNQGGCSMCGYVYDSSQEPPNDKDMKSQFDKAMQKASNLDKFMVKIYTSGSFLDENEVSAKALQYILQTLNLDERVVKVIAETRPEFVTHDTVGKCKDILDSTEFEIAIGLETSSDIIRRDSINKGFRFSNFIGAAQIAGEHDVTTKAYLLLKPPFIPEGTALDDMVQSVDEIVPYVSNISINLCNVQKGTFVEWIWQKHQYRPPWLWSIVEVLRKSKVKHPDTIITSDPVGAGSKRGPHNCNKCDQDVANAIRKFSITQNLEDLDIDQSCGCIELWKRVIKLDDYTYGALIVDKMLQ